MAKVTKKDLLVHNSHLKGLAEGRLSLLKDSLLLFQFLDLEQGSAGLLKTIIKDHVKRLEYATQDKP